MQRKRVYADTLSQLDDATSQALGIDDYQRLVRETVEQVAQLARCRPVVNPSVFVAQTDLQKIALKTWFEHNYTLPRGASDGVEVLRSELMRQVNQVLSYYSLPCINRRDPLWCNWFLVEVVGLETNSLDNGKPVMLCPRRTVSNLVSSLRQTISILEQAASTATTSSSSSSSTSSSPSTTRLSPSTLFER
jgi:hypothetical protein